MNTYPKQPSVYLLRNLITDKIYVGKAHNTYRRMISHKHSEKLIKHTESYIINAIKKYGWLNFTVEILELFDNNVNNDLLLEQETKWITDLDATNPKIGYNLLKRGRDWTGYKHSEESKQKMREAHKNCHSGKNNPMFGKHHSEATKRKMSENRKGKYIGINNGNYGNKYSLEVRKKMSDFAKTKDFTYLKRKVEQIDIETGKVIRVFDSISEAALFVTGTKRKNGGIANVCTGYIDKDGYARRTAYGFKWRYSL